MRVLKTFVKNYGYGSFIGVLSCSNDSDWKKTYLKYYEVKTNGTLDELSQASKETYDLEKAARLFINKQNDYILWSF